MRWILLLFALTFFAPESWAQIVIKRSEQTVMLSGDIFFLHSVRHKETLYSIAAAYGVTQQELLDRNPFAEQGIKAGQTLLVPKVPLASKPKPVPTPVPAPNAEPKREHESFVEPTMTQTELLSVEPDEDNDLLDYQSDTSTFELGEIRRIDPNRPLHITMLLPFGGDINESNFVDFYRGVLLALERLTAQGASVELNVISTAASPLAAQGVIESGALNSANLIIGPVYADVFEVVANYAAQNRVPIISPLGSSGMGNNPFVVEVAPSESDKWTKIVPMLTNAQSNVVLINDAHFADTATLIALRPLLPATTRTIDYNGKATSVNTLMSALSRTSPNVVVVPTNNESTVEGILSRLSSINASHRYDISVVGMPRWARFTNLSLELFFKLSVVYPSSYFFDRSDGGVASFYGQYIGKYSDLPSLYAFRGYDVATIFVGELLRNGSRMMLDLGGTSPQSLQTPYTFEQVSPNGKFVNTDWVKVSYTPSFHVIAE